MSDAAELVVHGPVADAHPTVVGSQVGDRDATEMGAHGRADQDLGVACRAEDDLASFIQDGLSWVFVVLLMDFLSGKSPHKDRRTIPDNLKHLSRRKPRDINLHIGIPIIASPTMKPSNKPNRIKPSKIKQTPIDNRIEQINLRPADISLMFVIDAILVKPVIDCSRKVDVITEVSGTG